MALVWRSVEVWNVSKLLHSGQAESSAVSGASS
jgi:hypothetical protein